MKNISRKYAFDDAFLLPKIPPESRFLESFDTDLPVFLKERFLAPTACDTIYNRLTSAGSVGRVGISTPDEAQRFTVKEEFRKTDFFHLNDEELRTYRKALEKVRAEVEAFFGVRLGKSEGLQTLGYGPGCKYVLHADNGDPVFEAGVWTGWKVTMDYRVISTILFLTDSVDAVTKPNQCAGGHVTFNYLVDETGAPLRVVPRKGLFVAFPSTPLFSHEVHEVTGGYRISLVEWYSADLLKR